MFRDNLGKRCLQESHYANPTEVDLPPEVRSEPPICRFLAANQRKLAVGEFDAYKSSIILMLGYRALYSCQNCLREKENAYNTAECPSAILTLENEPATSKRFQPFFHALPHPFSSLGLKNNRLLATYYEPSFTFHRKANNPGAIHSMRIMAGPDVAIINLDRVVPIFFPRPTPFKAQRVLHSASHLLDGTGVWPANEHHSIKMDGDGVEEVGPRVIA